MSLLYQINTPIMVHLSQVVSNLVIGNGLILKHLRHKNIRECDIVFAYTSIGSPIE